MLRSVICFKMFQNDDNHTKSNDIHILDTDNKAKVTMDELSLQSY